MKDEPAYTPFGEDWHEVILEDAAFVEPIAIPSLSRVARIEYVTTCEGTEPLGGAEGLDALVTGLFLDMHKGQPHSVRFHVHDATEGVDALKSYSAIVPWANVAAVTVTADAWKGPH